MTLNTDAADIDGVNDETGTFLVTHVDPEAAMLQAVTTSRIYTLDTNPGIESGDVVIAALEPTDDAGAVWSVDSLVEYPLTVESTQDPPPTDVRHRVDGSSPGDIEELDREWGTIHVIAVPDAATAIEDILEDPATRSRAARLGARHVIVSGADGVVSVEYRRTPPD